MEFRAYIGTKVFFGEGVIAKEKEQFKGLGKRAGIICGKSSAKLSGALEQCVSALRDCDIQYFVYDKIPNNPSVEDVQSASVFSRENNVDFIIGIGGGSPIDAAKGVAVLTANDMEPLGMYQASYPNDPLPLVAIPTTAGTGTEVTPYSVLTRNDLKTKKSFGNDKTFPIIAFVDASFTNSLPYSITVDTAIDAFTHALEGFLSKKANPYSDILAKEAIKIFGESLDAIANNDISFNTRKSLMYMSTLAGMVISHTGTTLMHGLGYNLTYYNDVPHGRANAYFLREYLKFNYDVEKEKIDLLIEILGLKSIDEFADKVDSCFRRDVEITLEQIETYAKTSILQNNSKNSKKQVTQKDLHDILVKSLKA